MQPKVDGRSMREMNRALLLGMIGRDKIVSRTELARRSSLSKPTVSAIVDDLIGEGLVREVGFAASASRRGRPTRLLELNASSAAYLGIHFGVRRTTLAVADARGRIRAAKSVESFRGQPERGLAAIPGLANAALREVKLPRSRLQGIGVALPGLVDHATGACVLAPNLRWFDVPVQERLTREFGVLTTVRNITHAGAIAEARLGAARGARNFAWIYVGSGIGSAIVIERRIFYGTDGYSGELGHCAVMEGGPICGCGRTGCLETVASGTAIARAARGALGASRGARTSRSGSVPDAQAVAIAAREGDAPSREILARAGEYLGIGISYLLNLFNPEMVVLGGRVIQADEYLMGPIRASVARHALRGESVPIVTSTLGSDIMLQGSVLFAMGADSSDDTAFDAIDGEPV